MTAHRPFCDAAGVKEKHRRVTWIDGIAYPRGERGGLTAFCLWYGGKALLLLLGVWIFVRVVDGLVSWLLF